VLRGDTEPITLGERTNVQDNAVLHTDPGIPLTIGRSCTVGHRATLHSCTIGDNTLVGIGATILNRTRVGNNCLIGAHTLIPEGKEIPDGVLVLGSPGKVVRPLTPAEIQTLTVSADFYVMNWRRFKAELRADARGLREG